tara:strand:- start:27 stop:536 length:510 start_codon:yes stop_codon:yes gene_type:complete
MIVERMAKFPDDFKRGLFITPMGRCHINQAYSVFLEQNPETKMDNFLVLYGNISFHKIQRAVQSQSSVKDVIIARDSNDHIHALYVYCAKPKDIFHIDQIIIPGPLARQKILKQFIEHMINLALEFSCTRIQINNISNKDWKTLFLTEAGAKVIKPDCLQLNLISEGEE